MFISTLYEGGGKAEEPNDWMRFFPLKINISKKLKSVARMKTYLKKATIIKKNGVKQIFEAISITEKGIYTGVIISNKGKESFQEHSFIPKDQIERITILDNQGKYKDIDF